MTSTVYSDLYTTGMSVGRGVLNAKQLIEQGLTSYQTHGDDFYRSYNQTNSVKALKEASRSFRLRLKSHHDHSTMLQL